jgi:hypothetical protein
VSDVSAAEAPSLLSGVAGILTGDDGDEPRPARGFVSPTGAYPDRVVLRTQLPRHAGLELCPIG